METHRLVLPEDLNQFGYLFGGRLLAWIDEASWIAASLDFPEARFVTVAMNEVVFRHSVKKGTILAIESRLKKGRDFGNLFCHGSARTCQGGRGFIHNPSHLCEY